MFSYLQRWRVRLSYWDLICISSTITFITSVDSPSWFWMPCSFLFPIAISLSIDNFSKPNWWCITEDNCILYNIMVSEHLCHPHNNSRALAIWMDTSPRQRWNSPENLLMRAEPFMGRSIRAVAWDPTSDRLRQQLCRVSSAWLEGNTLTFSAFPFCREPPAPGSPSLWEAYTWHPALSYHLETQHPSKLFQVLHYHILWRHLTLA